MSAASRKGYAGERPIEVLLQDQGYLVWRPRAGKAADCGDFGGLPVVVSVKNHQRMDLADWVSDVERQVVHAGLNSGVVWHKKRGKSDPRDWYVSTSGRLFLPLLELAAQAWEIP